MIPASRPIDDTARDGRFWAVSAPGQRLSVARFRGGRWEFSSGRALPFTPWSYLP